jgi:DNA-3-methyladenine glycosylase
LGSILECEVRDGRASGRIVETEAYLGPRDAASHAARGLTPRTLDLFGPPGTSYVYFIYGMHWCLNAVTAHVGEGMAVLVRAIEPLDGIALMRERRSLRRRLSKRRSQGQGRGSGESVFDQQLTNGPGKLCEALGIDGELSGLWLQRPPVTLRRGRELSDSDVLVSPRIGISKATRARHRYFVRNNPFVSREPAHFRAVPYSPAEG